MSSASLQAYARDRLGAAAAHPKERLLRRDFRLACLDVTAWFTSVELADLCERTLVHRKGDGHARTRLVIHAMDAGANGWEAPAVWAETAGFSSRDLERVLDATGQRGFYHHEGPSWQLYDRATGTGVQTLPTPLGLPPWELGSPLRLFLHWAYAGAEMRLTHAATLGRNGRGVLIVGPSGSGKSGTTLAGLVRGMATVGDDYVLVEAGADVIAYPVFARLRQDPEGLRRAGVSPRGIDVARPGWHGKIELDATAYAPQGLADRLEICALLLPEIARARRTSLRRVTPHAAALALVPSAVLQLPGDSTQGFRFLTGLARRLPAFRLTLSEDPADIAGAITAFLATEGADAG